MVSVVPGDVSRIPKLGGESGFMIWVAGAITIVSGMAAAYFWCYRRKIENVFRVYIEDAVEKDFRDVMSKFGLRSRIGSLDSFPTSPNGFWVAENGGEIVGFVGLGT